MDWMFFPGDTDNRAEPRFAVQRGAPFEFLSFLKLCWCLIAIEGLKADMARNAWPRIGVDRAAFEERERRSLERAGR